MHSLTGVRLLQPTETDPCAMCVGVLNTKEIVMKGRLTLCEIHVHALRARIDQLNKDATE